MVSSFFFPIVRTNNGANFIVNCLKCNSNDKVVEHDKTNIIYINSVSLSICLLVCDGGFGGWAKERPMKQRATNVSL